MVFAYLLVGEEASLLVDTGCAHNPQQEILPYLASIGLAPHALTWILITHSDLDHQGGNAPMKAAAPQAHLICHRFDLPWIESTEALIAGRYSQFESDDGIGYGELGKAGIRAGCLSAPIDLALSGGERFRLGPDWWVEAIHTPGHTWGHIALWDPRSRTLISGEATMGVAIPAADWSPAMPPTYCYVDTYLATQDRLLAMPIDLLASAHWPLQQGTAVREFIAESRTYCEHVGERLLEFAQTTGGFTLRQAIETLGPTLGRWPAATNGDFSYGMAGNLESLTRRGLLQMSRNDANLRVWSPS
jgi:glyoxylase-like metal-dependent hydrolase (beta-lactamase superfamily II)